MPLGLVGRFLSSWQARERKQGYSLLRGIAQIILFGATEDALKQEELRNPPPEKRVRFHAAWRLLSSVVMGDVKPTGNGQITVVRAEKSDKEEWFMKVRIVGLLAVLSLFLAFAFFSSTPAAPHKANLPSTPAANALPATPAAATPAEPHPEIREAIASLRRAKEHMEHAAHDFGGHRVEALKATDEALRQLEECLKYDKD